MADRLSRYVRIRPQLVRQRRDLVAAEDRGLAVEASEQMVGVLGEIPDVGREPIRDAA